MSIWYHSVFELTWMGFLCKKHCDLIIASQTTTQSSNMGVYKTFFASCLYLTKQGVDHILTRRMRKRRKTIMAKMYTGILSLK